MPGRNTFHIVVTAPDGEATRVTAATVAFRTICWTLRMAFSRATSIDQLLELRRIVGAMSRELTSIEDWALRGADASADDTSDDRG